VIRTRVIPGSEHLVRTIRTHLFPKKPNSLTASPNNLEGALKIRPGSPLQRLKDALTLAGVIPDKHNSWLPNAFFKGLIAIRAERPAALYASGPPFTTFLIGYILKRFTGLPLVIDFRDPWLDNPYNNYQFSFERAVNARLESKCVSGADRIISTTDVLKLALQQRYPFRRAESFVTITNGYDEDDFKMVLGARGSRGENAPLMISHVGTIYSKRRPEKFVEALSSLIGCGAIDRDRLVIRFIGTIDDPGIKESISRIPNSPRVVFTGHVRKEDALTMGYESDGLLLIQPGTALQIPAKLFEYIRLQVPIFAVSGPGATKDFIEKNDFGVVAMDHDVADIAKKFYLFYRQLLERPPLSASHPSRLRGKNESRFEARHLTTKLAETLNDIA